MSSFSRLRLGWIDDEQVVQVLPGENRAITLQPLGNGKGTLVIRIPGISDTYYLLENRQKVAGDPIMPSDGLVVLHVDESKEDGEGIVRIVDANHKVPYFGAAPFGVKKGQAPSLSLPQDVAIEMLWQQGLDTTVMVTNRSRAPKVQEVAHSFGSVRRNCSAKTSRAGSSSSTASRTPSAGEARIISSLEAEKIVLLHPAIVDAAAVPVPSEFDEDEVLIAVQPRQRCTIDPVELTTFLTARMAHFMVPRYLRVLEEMPRTPTNKVCKPLLREQGITADTWDREAAGIVLKRERLS